METLLCIGIVHSLFIILFLLSKPQKNKRDIIIALWMVFLGLPMLSELVSQDGLDLPIPFLRDKLPYAFTFGPLLLLYTSHITGGRKWSKSQYLIHFLPFVFASVYKLIFVPEMTFNPNLDSGNSKLGNVLALAILSSAVGYSFVTLHHLKKHKIEVLNQFSSLSTAISLKWLKWLTIVFLFSCVQPFILILLDFPEILHTRIFALVTLMIVVSFFGLKQLQIFSEAEIGVSSGYLGYKEKLKVANPDLELSPTNRSLSVTFIPTIEQSVPELELIDKVEPSVERDKGRYERSGLTDERSQQMLVQLESHMAVQKPYLDSNLTADKLALQLSIPRYLLSQVFSEQLGTNFYQFINEHRIDAVRSLMADPANQSMTILDMAHRCGFNSKSTFNKFFKTITNMTPSQYRKQL
ncbi:helix-turn-helix domain-containing protein [Vibrio algarum]|uniref:Helix-turn-helix domain-containing protein n=1 Tax=Vibrio algarum TaxID=3020714 RepID=A0ABT4YVV7_9VIBR|nr:helix-turn-helix domain-containing protein [Vibrio sp. KJ40-1]MDB1125286.1 helix-turn-helix domain-containing protein [Vibrio sp. KJ40-1]